jgi:hypothetical protein
MVVDLQVLVMAEQFRRIAVVVTGSAGDRVRFALLDSRMTLPAGDGQVVLSLLLMTQAAVFGVQIFEFGVTELIRGPVIIMAVRACCRLLSGVERMMAGGAGIGILPVCPMVEEDGSCRVLQIDPIGSVGNTAKQVAGDDR